MSDKQLRADIGAITQGLPGLDTGTALERLGGNISIYISFISRFYNEYCECGSILSDLLSKNNLVEAHRLVHSIKSLAGNLGADNLYRSSIRLEADMKRGTVAPSPLEVDQFIYDLSLVLRELNAFFITRDLD